MLIYGYSFILSEENAPGMILAQGRLLSSWFCYLISPYLNYPTFVFSPGGVGPALSQKQSDLFYSGDGGVTWRMVRTSCIKACSTLTRLSPSAASRGQLWEHYH